MATWLVSRRRPWAKVIDRSCWLSSACRIEECGAGGSLGLAVFAACAVGDAVLLAAGRAFGAITSERMHFLACFLLNEHLG
jgi:hypothetical protein